MAESEPSGFGALVRAVRPCVRLSSPRYSLIQLRGCQTGKNTAARNQYAPIREQRCGVSRAPDLHPTGNAERASRRIVDLRKLHEYWRFRNTENEGVYIVTSRTHYPRNRLTG